MSRKSFETYFRLKVCGLLSPIYIIKAKPYLFGFQQMKDGIDPPTSSPASHHSLHKAFPHPADTSASPFLPLQASRWLQ